MKFYLFLYNIVTKLKKYVIICKISYLCIAIINITILILGREILMTNKQESSNINYNNTEKTAKKNDISECTIKNDLGNVKISEDVIISMVEASVKEVKGVAAIYKKNISNSKKLIYNLKSAISMQKGIVFNYSDDGLEISIQVFVKYGYKILDVAKEIQKNIVETVQIMTGLTVKKINVIINDINAI